MDKWLVQLERFIYGGIVATVIGIVYLIYRIAEKGE